MGARTAEGLSECGTATQTGIGRRVQTAKLPTTSSRLKNHVQVNLQSKPGEPISGEGPDCRTRPLAPIAKEALPSGRSAPAQFLGPALAPPSRPSLTANMAAPCASCGRVLSRRLSHAVRVSLCQRPGYWTTSATDWQAGPRSQVSLR